MSESTSESMARRIERKLGSGLSPAHLEILDESGMHASGPGAETHFRVLVVSDRFEGLPLLPGSYSLRGHAMDPEGLRLCDTAEIRFSVRGASRELGMVRLPHRWLDGGGDPQ